MKKIPTLFTRVFHERAIIDILPEITPGCEEAFKNGIATVKIDGSCCAIINGEFYKRYDAKKGKTPPEGAIPCCDPDPVTGHWPHWVKVDFNNPADKWFVEAYNETIANEGYLLDDNTIEDGTYEAIGKHFNGNPYGLDWDILVRHGDEEIYIGRTFEDVKEYLKLFKIEGVVFWLDDKPVCKIKRSDFGLEWPVKGE